MYEEYTGEYRIIIDNLLRDFEGIINKQDKIEIEKARKNLKESLDEIEFQSLF